MFAVVRIDRSPRDTFAAETIADALDLAMPDDGSVVEHGMVKASDAGAARLLEPMKWKRLQRRGEDWYNVGPGDHLPEPKPPRDNPRGRSRGDSGHYMLVRYDGDVYAEKVRPRVGEPYGVSHGEALVAAIELAQLDIPRRGLIIEYGLVGGMSDAGAARLSEPDNGWIKAQVTKEGAEDGEDVFVTRDLKRPGSGRGYLKSIVES
jgi:hypothetical protein